MRCFVVLIAVTTMTSLLQYFNLAIATCVTRGGSLHPDVSIGVTSTMMPNGGISSLVMAPSI